MRPTTETDRRRSSALGTQFYKVPVNYARECDKKQERVCARIKTRACAGRPKQYLSFCFKLEEEEKGSSRLESKEIGSARGMNEETKANHQNCHKQTLQKKTSTNKHNQIARDGTKEWPSEIGKKRCARDVSSQERLWKLSSRSNAASNCGLEKKGVRICVFLGQLCVYVSRCPITNFRFGQVLFGSEFIRI